MSLPGEGEGLDTGVTGAVVSLSFGLATSAMGIVGGGVAASGEGEGLEKEARKHFIEHGWLEAVIGLPAGLFYGTGIPACVLVINKKQAAERKHVFFINADREYREGKAQNFLRPEDIAKIVHVYRERKDVAGYARLVPVDEIAVEEYNRNIRRYVDIVVHELSHFRYLDHADAFWNEVDKIMPTYRERKEWLKKNGASMDV